MIWWKETLMIPNVYRSLLPQSFHDLDIWVDASDWGIGMVVGKRWASWRFIPNWRLNGREMGWAETVAVELTIMWIIHDSHIGSDVLVKVRSDNTGVIGASKGG